MRLLNHWIGLGLALLALCVPVGLEIYKAHAAIASESQERLLRQAQAVNTNLTQRLQATSNGLESIRIDLPALLGTHFDLSTVNRRLRAMVNGMTAIRSLAIVDMHGVIIASDSAELIGVDFSGAELHHTIRHSTDAAQLYVSAPFTTPFATYSIALGKVILGDYGAFNGYVMAILDPDYFRVLLDSVLYASDMRATLIHGDGKIVIRVPDLEHTTGTDLSTLPNSFFNQYLQSRQPTQVFNGISASTKDHRLTVLQAIRPQTSQADKPLLISVSREVKAMYALWRQQMRQQAALLAVIALMATSGLAYYQRRQLAQARRQAHDDEQKRRADQKFRESAFSLKLAIEGARLGTWHWTVNAETIRMSDSCLSLFGLRPGARMTFDNFFSYLHPHDRQRVRQALSRSIEEKVDYNEDYRVIRPDGTQRWVNAIGRPFCSANGAVERLEGIVQDITDRRAMEEQIRQSNGELHRLARTDALTGLPNRLAANERFHLEFVGMKRSRKAYAVLMVDIDFFKRVNDTHGHAVGDQVLQNLARTLQRTLRESDFAARFGGEEFLVLLPATDLPAALQVAEKLRQAVESSPDPVAGRTTVSIGVAMADPEHAKEGEAIRQADDALYQAKHGGRNQVRSAQVA